MQPRISIISPVYNTEKFLHKCMDSIIAQSFQDWELISVNDGSTDNSLAILEEYALKDSRIRVITQSNRGVGAARQAGLDAASGEFVIHVDSDDWIEPKMLEELYAKAKETNADVTICDYFVNKGTRQTIIHENISPDPQETLSRILRGENVLGGLWQKLIKRSLFKRYNVKFLPGVNYCEDILVCAQILKHPEVKVAQIPKALYHYQQNEASITNALSRKSYESLKLYLIYLKDILPEKMYEKDHCHAKYSVFIQAFIGNVLSHEEIRMEFDQIKDYAFRKVKSLRWRIGLRLIQFRLYSMAHLFLKY